MSFRYFDGHNDVLLHLGHMEGEAAEKAFLEGRPEGHVDLPRARSGGMAGGFCALYAQNEEGLDFSVFEGETYFCPLPPEVPRQQAWDQMARQIAVLNRIVARSEGQVVVCRDIDQLTGAVEAGQFAVVLHAEGAEAIDEDLVMLEILHALGLRSLGPVWSRPTIFAHGVPMAFPSGPDIGPGLTDAGRRLVRRCNELGIMIDLSHMNEAGFWDIAELSDAPLVATHSNMHELCPVSRNLTRKQLEAIRESDGLVGVNLATAFLRPDGKMDAQTPLSLVLDQFAGLVDVLGEDRVGLGSDFDGAIVPGSIGDVAGVEQIFDGLRARGMDDALLEKLALRNWLRVLRQTWK